MLSWIGSIFEPSVSKVKGSIFDYNVEDISGAPLELSSLRGKKAYLVVNVASKWGLTNQNYAELQSLYSSHSSEGLEILGFPCNRFGGQEPGSNEEIDAFAKDKGATFPLMGKIDCGSEQEVSHPLFLFLTANGAIKWNFTKFLCDSEGVPVSRYGPTQNPLSFEDDIKRLLAEGTK